MSRPFDLESEIRDLVARRDIGDAVQRYMRGLDRLDPALQRSAFHDDAFIDCGLMAGGADDFVAFSQDLLGAMDGTQHLMGQVRIVLHDGENASGEVYFQAWHGIRDDAGKPRDLFVAGRYVDEYACKNGEWRIAMRTLITDWVKDDPANHTFWDQTPPPLAAGRLGADFSETRDWPV